MSKENKYYLGKCDFYGRGGKRFEAFITWDFDGKNFSMCAEVWNARKTDILMGGQCVAEVAAMFPDDKKAQRMAAIWKRWHLNDMKEGESGPGRVAARKPDRSCRICLP